MNARWGLLAVLVFAAGVTAAAQVQRDRQVTPRDKPTEVTGTGVVAGTVITADERQQPVRRVSVLLASGQIVTPRTAVTDDEGRFAFTGLAPGNYTLVGQKPAWVNSVYGARSATDTQGVPIAVANGQRVEGLRLPIMRGAVVTGAVRLASGQPARGLTVQVMQARTEDGRRRLVTVAAPSDTNDIGVYRVFGLPPGDYVVQARAQSGFTGGELRQVTDAEVRWADQSLAAASGSSRAPDAATVPPPAGPAVTYATVFFPGTTFTSDAGILTVRAGEERANVDFSLSFLPTAKVTGTVIGPDGAPSAGATVTLEPEGAGDGDFIGMVTGLMAGGRSVTRQDGAFTLSGVLPGRHTLMVRGTPRRPDAPPVSQADASLAQAMALANSMTGMFGGGPDNPASLWAAEPIVVNGQDVGPLSLALRDSLTIEGAIVVEGGGVPPDAATLRIGISKPSTGDPMAAIVGRLLGSSSGQAKADGTFAVRGLTPGRYQVSVTGKGMRVNTMIPGIAPSLSGWVVKSVRWGERDLADTGIDLQADVPVSGVVVTLTNQPAELGGKVIDAAGRPTGAFPIVVFASDRAYWASGSRRVLQAQPATDGTFTVIGLPAGEYFLAAVTRLEPGDLANRQFLEELIPASLKITIRDGEKKTQDLKLSGGG